MALDCAVKNVTVCVISQGKIVAASHENECRELQSTVLLKAIDQVLVEGGVKPADIENVLYAYGPGSFTSLRVGLATLKGLFTSSTHFFTTSSLMCRYFSQTVEEAIAVIPMGRAHVAIGLWEGSEFWERLISDGEFLELKKNAHDLVFHPQPQGFLKIIEAGRFISAALETASLNYFLLPRY